jgi:hypothetical protein
MLHIDYSIIPLTEEDRQAIRRVVQARIESGQLPQIEKSHHGRVAVVNPDAVQTVHHVPDELRTPLRRALHSTSEGAIPISAERIYKGLIEGEGPLYVLILELESEFKHLPEFLDYLPQLRERYPDLGMFLVGGLQRIMEALRTALAQGGTALRVTYPDARGTVEISDAGELTQVQGDQKEPPSFSLPFFSQIRLALREGQKPIAFSLDTLRKLHGHFGAGEIKEIDMGGGRVEKVVIIDLPMRLIKDFQFRQDRGLDFHGVVRAGLTILSRNFEKEKLEYRWVPVASLDALLRRVPGKDVETIDLRQVQALRINTFTGQISFVTKQAGDQISLEDAESVVLVKPARAGARGAGHAVEIRFDHLIVVKGSSHFDRLHAAIKLHFYGRLMSGEEEQRVKLERYTRRLTVGSVGPLAGHTLKLLRRYGLERLIEPDSFHYLCDTAAQLPEHHLAAQRLEEKFQALLAMLRDIASVGAGGQIRVDDITHKMPVITEWIDQESVRLEDIGSSDLETAHREIRIMMGFIDHEFQRQFEIGSEDLTFFKKIEACQAALLLSKWLSDYKRGAYGAALPQGAHPDLLFLATPRDKTENDQHYFLPALVCSDFFADPGNKALFDRGDFHFPVFLETQLALAEHQARQEGEARPSLESIEKYLDALADKMEAHLRDLEASTQHIDLSGSPEYQRLMKQEEEAYHARYRQFFQEREQVTKRHEETEQAFQEVLREIAPQLKLPPQPHPGWLQGDRPDPGIFSEEFVQAARAALKEHQLLANRTLAAVGRQLSERAGTLTEFTTYLAELQRAHRQWQSVESAAQFAEQTAQVDQTLPARLAVVKKLDEKAREAYLSRIASQAASADSEMQQAQAQEELRWNRSAQAVRIMQAAAERLAAQSLGLEAGQVTAPAQLDAALGRAVALAKRVAELTQSLLENGDKLTEELTRHGQAMIRLRQAALHVHKLRTELAALEAVAAQQAPRLAEPPRLAQFGEGAEQGAAQREALQRAFQEHQGRFAAWAAKLQSFAQPPPELKKARETLEAYQHFRDREIELAKLASRKQRLRRSVSAIEERLKIMEDELVDLPRRVERKFMPARKELLVNIFVPEAQRDLEYARQAKSFVRELNGLRTEEIKQLYLDRAVFRRFSSRQFARGAQIALNPQSPLARQLHNLQPALNHFAQTLEFNYSKAPSPFIQPVKLEFIKSMEPSLIWSFIQQLHGMGKEQRFGYLVLPGTLPLEQAVRMMNQKDQLYGGLPMLVLVYLSKFDPHVLHGDAALRDAYFRALRHNVILNIDNRVLVDNPVAMAERLAQETLGSAWDLDRLEPLPEDEGVVAVKARS